MSGKSFAMSVTVQHPTIKYVSRLDTGEMLVSIGNPEKYDHVALIVTDEQWRAMVRDVDQRIAEHDQKKIVLERLEYLRGEIRAERMSWGEIAELQSLASYIQPGDVELAEWAGISEAEK